MNCQQYQYWIMLQESGELGVWKRRQLARHLANCASCRSFQTDLLRLKTNYQPTLISPRPQISSAIETAIDTAAAASKPRKSYLHRPLLQAAAALLIIAGGIFWLYQLKLRHFPDMDCAGQPAAPLPADGDDMEITFAALLHADQTVELRRLNELPKDISPLEVEIMQLEGLVI